MHVPQIRRMWEGGPLRQWSETRHGGNWLASDRGGFTGSYVCGECRQPCDGVYLARHVQKWLWGACKAAVATRQEQPAQTPVTVAASA